MRVRSGSAAVLVAALVLSAVAAACDRPAAAPAADGGRPSAATQDTTGGFAAPVAGGDIKAGDAQVDGGRIPTGVARFRMSAVANGEERELGTLTQEVAPVEEGGRQLLRMVMSMKSPAGNGVDTSHVDARTLAPVRLRAHNAEGTISIDFNGVKVLGNKVSASGQVQPVTQSTAAPAFDASMIDYLVTALPLSLGYTARLPIFMIEQGGLSWYSVRVIGDAMEAGQQSYAVDVVMPVGLARYSVAKKDRRLLAATISFAQGGGVLKMTRLPD
ncbi:MAG TPA: hypothetical protein VF035_09925 [Longimicrobiales bacterium]